MAWQREVPGLPPESNPNQHWWFYGKMGPACRVEYSVIEIWRMDGLRLDNLQSPWALYGFRGSAVEPVNEKWDGWWCPIVVPDPPI